MVDTTPSERRAHGARSADKGLGRALYLMAESLRRPRKALFLLAIEATYGIQRLWRRDWILVSPQMPSRSYTLWKLSRMAGLRLVSARAEAPRRAPLTQVHHHDVTYDEAADARMINGGCSDISKSHVDAVFHAVFGYGAAIDPTTHQGQAVRKSEINGSHSGTLVTCPLPAHDVEGGHVYQRLVSNALDPTSVREFRVAILGYKVFGVLDQRRHITARLKGRGGGGGLGSTWRAPDALFSPNDLARIERFCRKLHLEFGELDILPDHEEQRLYIVDANKTPTQVTSATAFTPTRFLVLWRWARAFRRSLVARQAEHPTDA